MTARLLVVENDPSDPPNRLADWLTAAGLELVTIRPYADEPLPDLPLPGSPDEQDYSGLLVMGGPQCAYGVDPGWFAALRGLLAGAVAAGLPTVGVCLGAQLLAQATGGTVTAAANGPEIGLRLVAKRDAAATDELFADLPFTPDVVQWHSDEISAVPPGARLLAAGTHTGCQAFAIGRRAWGVQFHPEADAALIERWIAADATGGRALERLGIDPAALLDRARDAEADLVEVWQPFAQRFAAAVAGRAPAGPAMLPLTES